MGLNYKIVNENLVRDAMKKSNEKLMKKYAIEQNHSYKTIQGYIASDNPSDIQKLLISPTLDSNINRLHLRSPTSQLFIMPRNPLDALLLAPILGDHLINESNTNSKLVDIFSSAEFQNKANVTFLDMVSLAAHKSSIIKYVHSLKQEELSKFLISFWSFVERNKINHSNLHNWSQKTKKKIYKNSARETN